jgi:hypothetical protein
MNNRDMQATWKYHDGTKHSYWSIRNNPHFLDWANRPQPFKIYPKIDPVSLPRDVPQTGVAALSAISEPVPSSRADSVPDLRDLARILYFSAGITKQSAHPGGEIYFRAAACTGALYEIELYVVTGDLAGLDAGVYHFNPADVSLRLLRKGDFRRNLAQATAMDPSMAHAPATIICTGTSLASSSASLAPLGCYRHVFFTAQPVIRTRVLENHSRGQDFLLGKEIPRPPSLPGTTGPDRETGGKWSEIIRRERATRENAEGLLRIERRDSGRIVGKVELELLNLDLTSFSI